MNCLCKGRKVGLLAKWNLHAKAKPASQSHHMNLDVQDSIRLETSDA